MRTSCFNRCFAPEVLGLEGRTALSLRSGNFALKCYWAVAFPYSAGYRPILVLAVVSEMLVYYFPFLALCWLAYFSNTCFTPPFASRAASPGTAKLKFISLTSTCPLTTPIKSHPHKFNYCDLFFVMPSSALTGFAKVKFTQNIIALWYLCNHLWPADLPQLLNMS